MSRDALIVNWFLLRTGAGQIGYTEIPRPAGPAMEPVTLDVRKVFGIGMSYKF